MSRILLAAAALTLLALPAYAQLGGKTKTNLKTKTTAWEIKNAEVVSFKRGKAELKLFLYKPGAAKKNEVVVEWVEGKKREVKLKKKFTFKGSRGGFPVAATVDVKGKNLAKGHLQIKVTACSGGFSKCSRLIKLDGGDLKIDDQLQQRGSNGVLALTVKNEGPGKAKSCKVKIQVAGKTVKEFRVSALSKGKEKALSWRFKRRDFNNKPYKAVLDCKDLASGNNSASGKLK